MAGIDETLGEAAKQAERSIRQASPWIEKIARAGYAAKGAVYIVIGLLAVEAAFTGGGKTTNSQGALATIAQEPYGRLMLAIVGIGLAAYAVWRFVEAALDAENKGSDTKGVMTRLGYTLSGIGYAALAYTAVRLLMGRPANSGGNQNMQDWTGRVMSVPFGRWAVAAVGLVIIGVGLMQMAHGYKAKFSDKLAVSSMGGAMRNSAVLLGRWGYIARGIVFAIVGGFIAEAAWHSDPRQAKGLGSALDLLAAAPYGPLVLGVVAAGLASYGLYMLVEARYRRISV